MLPVRLLFVCTGNVCRSPMAKWVAAHKGREAGLELVVDSAGTSRQEVGNPATPLAIEAARARGYPCDEHVARAIRESDFLGFDLVLAATEQHIAKLRHRLPEDATARIEHLMRHAHTHAALDIADPWGGDRADYERALDMIEEGVAGLIEHIAARIKA